MHYRNERPGSRREVHFLAGLIHAAHGLQDPYLSRLRSKATVSRHQMACVYALIARGLVTLWIDEQVIAVWRATGGKGLRDSGARACPMAIPMTGPTCRA